MKDGQAGITQTARCRAVTREVRSLPSPLGPWVRSCFCPQPREFTHIACERHTALHTFFLINSSVSSLTGHGSQRVRLGGDTCGAVQMYMKHVTDRETAVQGGRSWLPSRCPWGGEGVRTSVGRSVFSHTFPGVYCFQQ